MAVASSLWLDSLTLPQRAALNGDLEVDNLDQYTDFASPNAAAEEFIDQEVLDDPIVYPADQSKLEFISDTGAFEINFSDAFIEAKG